MAFIKTKLAPVKPDDLYNTLRLTYGFNDDEEEKKPGILAKPTSPASDADVVAAGFFNNMLTKSKERAAKLRAEAIEQYSRDSAEEVARLREILGITRSKVPQRDMTASEEFDATVPAPESEPIIEGEPTKLETLIPESINLMVDTLGNEILDRDTKTDGIMSKDEADYETGKKIREEILKSEGIMSKPDNDSADGVQPTDGKVFELPEYKVYESPDEMSELEILARTIEAEAALEPYKGKIAVGATIANRAESGSYGKDIRGVILRRGQFSPWNSWTGYAKGEQGKDMMRLRASEDSYKAANAILTGNYEDPTDGATHYVNEKVSKPAWLGAMKGRKRGTVTIGNHLFGNADSNKKYDGKNYIYGRSSETTDQPVEAAPTTVKAIQRIIGTAADGDFGPTSRKKAIEYLRRHRGKEEG